MDDVCSTGRYAAGVAFRVVARVCLSKASHLSTEVNVTVVRDVWVKVDERKRSLAPNKKQSLGGKG